MVRIKEIPQEERPRERLLKVGARNISNEELLAIIIKTGSKSNSVKDIALNILNKIENINNLEKINMQTFKDIKGLGKVKTIELLAAIELGRRIFTEKNINSSIKFTSASIIYEYNRHLFLNLKQEYFYCLYLDNQNKLIERKLLFMGTINHSTVHPREIFKEAYLLSSSKIICLHNHPSNDIHPSREDYELTKKLVKIGKIEGVPVIDHLIIGEHNYYSFYDNTDLFS